MQRVAHASDIHGFIDDESQSADEILGDALEAPRARVGRRAPVAVAPAIDTADDAPVGDVVGSDVAFAMEMLTGEVNVEVERTLSTPMPGGDQEAEVVAGHADLEFDIAISDSTIVGAEPPPSAEVEPSTHRDDHDVEFDMHVMDSVGHYTPPVEETPNEEHDVHDVAFDAAVHGGAEPSVEEPAEGVEQEVAADLDRAVVGAAIEKVAPAATARAEHSDVAFDMELLKSGLKEDTDPVRVPTWSAILGEQLEGDTGDISIFGELVQKSRAFAKYAQARIAASRAVLRKEPGVQKARDWQIDFGPAWGPAGYTTTIRSILQVPFRGEKVIASDTGSPPGHGTRIMQVMVGQLEQRAGNGGNSTLTAFYANNSLGNGIRWDTCQRALSINVTVSFVQTCTFDMVVFGKCVLT